MAGNRSSEGVITAIKTILTADLPAKLDLLDTEYGATGDEVLADIAKVWLAPQERHQAQNVPALVLVAVGTEWLQEYGSEGVYQHSIAMELILRGNSRTTTLAPEELLTVKLQRTVRGIVETLEAKRQLTVSSTNNCDFIAYEGVAYSELFDTDESPLEKRAEVNFLVQISA